MGQLERSLDIATWDQVWRSKEEEIARTHQAQRGREWTVLPDCDIDGTVGVCCSSHVQFHRILYHCPNRLFDRHCHVKGRFLRGFHLVDGT